MIDNKKIEEAARCNANKYRNYPTLSNEDRDKVSICSFMEGTKWMQEEFLKNLWHPANEVPEKFRKILYTGDSINTTDTTMLIINNSWNTKVYLLKIKKWCYIDDLFPKEGD